MTERLRLLGERVVESALTPIQDIALTTRSPKKCFEADSDVLRTYEIYVCWPPDHPRHKIWSS